MNVVANTRSVGCLVIRAVNFKIRFFAQRDLQHCGNQMCLRSMIFAELLCGARGVEIAQTNKFYAINLVVPAQNFFESQFRFTVGTYRARRSGFVDWHTIRGAEDRAG